MKRILLLLPVLFLCGFTNAPTSDALIMARFELPGPPAFFMRELRERENAPLEVALVFGRAKGCENADPELINLVAKEAVNAGLRPKILAATIAVESQCTQYAISSRGAIGFTQVMPRVWRTRFDFADEYNLLNARDNIHVGATIMAGLIREYGLVNGVQRYNGLGVGCDTCDAGYSSHVLALVGKN